MAIVLPQGRFNNVSDAGLRWWLTHPGKGNCRILAVVGLHGNTFKPHTGTKTSVLLVQKWNDDPAAGPLCPYREDYPIFFAINQTPVKDNSGEYIFVKGPDGKPLLDLYGHQIVDHDLYRLQSVLAQQLENRRQRHHDDPAACAAYQEQYEALLPLLPDRPTIAEAFIAFAKKEDLSFFAEQSDPTSQTAFEAENAYTAHFSEASQADRLNAEYFQPKYEDVVKALQALSPKDIVPLEILFL